MNEAQHDSARSSGNVRGIVTSALLWWTMGVLFLSFAHMPVAQADCWLIEGEKGFVWLAICSQNQPPYESIPLHINSTIVDLRLNENKIRSIHFSSLSRFSNLTYLNLTKNDISYIEDGAFSAQFNLQVLQVGFNKLRNLTEGMLRGLGRLQYLYLQANQIETVSPNAFWECPAIENIDLSMNRIQQLDGNTFNGLSKLTTCELYSNPFSCSCELLGFLRWFAAFPNRTSERMVCDTPAGFSGYSLLSQNPRMPTFRNAFHALSTVCTDDYVTPYLLGSSDGGTPTILPDLSPCGLEDCPSGTLPDEPISFSPTYFDPDARPVMRLKEVTQASAVIIVQIPKPYSKMYILVLYNNSFFTDIQPLNSQREEIQLLNLKSHTEYTYCVASIRNSLRYNHTCLAISTGTIQKQVPNDSTATHYIMTILGCFFGMLIILGVVYHCLRKRKQHDDPKSKKFEKMKRDLIEMKYGAELEGGSQLSQKQMMPTGEALQRMPYLPAPSETDQYKVQEMMGTPKTTKGNYIEVRSDQSDRLIESAPPSENSQGSVAEISTIAKEVDKVNQIINNCIDALKSESVSFQAVKSGAVSTAEPQLVLISEHPPGKSNLLSPVYKGGYHHPLQRHHSMEAPLKRTSTSSSGSIRSPRSFRSDGAYRSESKYIEKSSLDESGILTVTPAAAILKSEAERMQHYSEHRHSYPGPHHVEEPLEVSASRKSSVFEPLTHSRPRELSYSQLSPQYHNFSGYSSPEYGCRPSLSLWERFKLHRKRHRDEDEYMAAGHALRRKVQFAKDEDLHDILDYWKGVSAQQKL
ncbi:protein ELFN1 [Trichomycterus rosablanca]|uniref:protein ELFN1 n=1 Tax=Trichomycterus rosablanca TaxID=2290929 RepID=UPI002F35EC5C